MTLDYQDKSFVFRIRVGIKVSKLVLGMQISVLRIRVRVTRAKIRRVKIKRVRLCTCRVSLTLDVTPTPTLLFRSRKSSVFTSMTIVASFGDSSDGSNIDAGKSIVFMCTYITNGLAKSNPYYSHLLV